MQTDLTTLFTEFFASAQASGVILIVCTLTAIVIAHSPTLLPPLDNNTVDKI